MTKQQEPVAAKELVDSSQTTLHSHPGGGGGGLVDKSGEETTDANGEAVVTFNTPYASNNYFILLGCLDPGDTPIAKVKAATKTVNGFTIVTEDDGGKAEPSVTVMWACGSYSNP